MLVKDGQVGFDLRECVVASMPRVSMKHAGDDLYKAFYRVIDGRENAAPADDIKKECELVTKVKKDKVNKCVENCSSKFTNTMADV